jgi:CheY-like chemotaxis protein
VHEELYELLRAVLGGQASTSEPVTAYTIPDVHSRLKILATDDVPVNQELIRAILEKRGHSVTLASNGLEAIAAWSSGSYDLLLMDVQMPEMDGLEATARIRQAEAAAGGHVPIIAMTAYAMSGDRERCINSGMDDYVTKPINPEELHSVIARVTGGVDLRLKEFPHSSPAPVCEIAGEDAVFDREGFLVRLGGNEDMVPRFLGLFGETATKNITELHQALKDGDYETARRNAHTIKGAAANVGALQLRAAALAFEKCDLQSDVDCRNNMLKAIEICYQRFLDETSCYHK